MHLDIKIQKQFHYPRRSLPDYRAEIYEKDEDEVIIARVTGMMII